jgi:pyridinium-3,5-bisthiocarboxylic acid mononucleotide nickel chelatase
MRVLYLDCFSGISGDMVVGALADLGVTPSAFEWELSNLEVGDFHLHFERQMRCGIAGVKFGVHEGATHVEKPELHPGDEHDHIHHEDDHDPLHEHSHHPPEHAPHQNEHTHQQHEHHHGETRRTFRDIRALLDGSGLSPFVKRHANSIFRRIAEAEAKIHGVQIEEVAFHEVGALDSIADIVMACIGLEALQVEQVHFSELVDGIGTMRCSHGDYPLPAPATLEILKGLPIGQIAISAELITPTGAAIVAEFQHSVGTMPRMRPQKIGYGLGAREFSQHPNVLRAVLGDLETDEKASEIIWEVEANIDDSSPEILGATLDQLLKAGAADAYLTPVQMKKNRPGVLLTALCTKENLDSVQQIIFRETTTFGLRFRQSHRVVLDREQIEVETEAGPIIVKVGRFHGNLLQVAPEFESCRALAEKSGIPLRRLYEIAVTAFWSQEKAI